MNIKKSTNREEGVNALKRYKENGARSRLQNYGRVRKERQRCRVTDPQVFYRVTEFSVGGYVWVPDVDLGYRRHHRPHEGPDSP